MSNLVEVRDLNIRFTGERTVHAVNDLSFSLGEGEVLGLLGESGSGKSVTLRALMRQQPHQCTQRHALARTGLPEQSKHLAIAERQAEIVHRMDSAFAGEANVEAANID